MGTKLLAATAVIGCLSTTAFADTTPDPAPEPKAEPAPPPPPVASPPEAKVVVTPTAVRDLPPHPDMLMLGMVGGGALALGTTIGLYFAESSNDDASLKAISHADYNSLRDKASTQRAAMWVTGIAGLGMFGVAAWRYKLLYMGHSEPKHDVGLAPAPGGGTLFVTGRF
jgi:hypothetical protein